MMTKERFAETNWKMTYEEYQKCDCTECKNEDCIHRGAYRRVPEIDGGLGLCPNLKESDQYNGYAIKRRKRKTNITHSESAYKTNYYYSN